MTWLPGVAACLSDAAAAALDAMPSGPHRRWVLQLAAARRAGFPAGWSREADLPEDVGVLAVLFSVPIAVELAVAASADSGQEDLARLHPLADARPDTTRRVLRRLAGSDGAVADAARRILGVLPLPPAEPVRLDLLGTARLRRGTTEVDDADWRRAKVRLLLTALVLRRGLRREALGTLLWPDLDEEAVGRNLRLTLHYVQRLLEPERAKGDAPYLLR
ncbi:MAG: hypothetical protein AAGK32_22235, partial [Actinomycetota bacterium]